MLMKKRLLIGIYDSGGMYTVHISKELDSGGFEPAKALTLEPESSIYIIQRDGYRLGGNAVLQLEVEEVRSCKGFWTDLKALPGTGNDEAMAEFAGLICQKVREATSNFYGREPVWVVGCPDHWLLTDAEARERYVGILERAGMKQVVICEEATAALSYYHQELQVVTEKNQSEGVLFVNWDSHALYDTYFYPPGQGEDRNRKAGGCELGTHFLDQAIVHAALYQPEKYGMEGLNHVPLMQKVQRWYEEDEQVQRWLYAHAGKLKETYFRAMTLPGLKPKRTRFKWEEKVDCGEGEAFRLVLSIAMMEELLSMPLEKIVPDFQDYPESVKADLGRDSFISRSEHYLEALEKRYPAYADAQDTLLILAGSVSQMDFVRRAAGIYFPNRKIDYDNCPQLSIGRGLIDYGKEMLNRVEAKGDGQKKSKRERTLEAAQDTQRESKKENVVVHQNRTNIREFEEEFDHIAADVIGDRLHHFCESFVQHMVKEVVFFIERYRKNPGGGRYSTGIGTMREWQSVHFHTLQKQYNTRLVEQCNEAFQDLLYQYGYQQSLFGPEENWLEEYHWFFMQMFDEVARGKNSFFETQNRIYAYMALEATKWLLEKRHLECRHSMEQRLKEREEEILRVLKGEVG